MKKLRLILILVLLVVNSFGQSSKVATNLNRKIINRIISEIEKEGTSSVSIVMKENDKKYQGYRLCDHQYANVDTLSMLCTDAEVDSLFYQANGSLRAVGFIIYAKRFNNKDSVVKRLRLLTTQDYVIFASSCSDAITFSNIAQFSYQLLTSTNLFFKPNFKLNRVDSLRIQRDIYYYERKILKKSISYFSFPIDEYLGEK